MDRFGRRILLLGSGSIVAIAMAAMGTFFYLQREWGEAEATAKIGWLPLVALMVFFVAYSSGYANVPFIIMGEVFPLRYRFILGPAASSFNLLCTFAVVRGFPSLKDAIGADATFWIFMGCTVVSLFFIFFFLPETKGKTLEEIERLFSNKPVTLQGPPDAKNSITPATVAGHDNLGFQLGENNTPIDSKADRMTDSDDDDEEDNISVVAPI